MRKLSSTPKHVETIFVKLREREEQGMDPGRSLKGHLWMVDGGWWKKVDEVVMK